MHEEVFNFFKDLDEGNIPFNGKFILVANDREFPGFNFPDLPGVHIRLKKEEILNLVGRKMKEDGADDLRLKLMMRNINSSDIVE
jgi:hypothetical protein